VATLRVQLRETLEVHDLVLDAEWVLEPAQLRGAHVRRKLSAFETGANLVPGLRPLGSTTGGLSLGRVTATDAGLRGLGARGGPQVVDLEGRNAGLLGVLLLVSH